MQGNVVTKVIHAIVGGEGWGTRDGESISVNFHQDARTISAVFIIIFMG